MQKKFIPILIAAFAAQLCHPAQSQTFPNLHPTTPVLPGPTVEGFALSIKTDKPRYFPGEQIILTITVTNRDKELGTVYPNARPYVDNQISISFPDWSPFPANKVVPRTIYGQVMSYGLGGMSNRRVTLSTGEEVSYSLPLIRHFDLSYPSTYKISVVRPIRKRDGSGKLVDLTSNTIEFVIDQRSTPTPPTPTPDKK